MSEASLNCWHCGESLTGVPIPIGRREECPQCAASLHVCRLCQFYDPGASKDCREPVADEISDKEAANFCDYFRPRGGLLASEDGSAAASRAKLAALFDGPSADAGGAGCFRPFSRASGPAKTRCDVRRGEGELRWSMKIQARGPGPQ